MCGGKPSDKVTMSFVNEFLILFRGMTIPAGICLIVGLVFIIIEIFQPGFGIFGVLGGILAVVGIVLRAIVGDGNVFAQVFLLLLFYVIFIVIAFLILAVTAKKGWLNRSPLIESSTAVAFGHSDGTADYSALVGAVGVARTDLRPVGKVEIDAVLYDVVTEGFFIKNGEAVRVVSVEGSKITVIRAE